MAAILTQFGLASAFLSGLYDDFFTSKALAEQGDFGHGTFNAIDGEMIVLDGTFYRADVHGNISIANTSQKIPIATVINFQADSTFELQNIDNFTIFQKQIADHFHKKNSIYAIRVDATFQSMLARSEIAQNKPYEPIEISMPKLQHSFVLEDIQATLVGYFVPDVYKTIILSGFHFHFINDARTKGGHVFDFKCKHATVSIQCCTELCVKLPLSPQFDQMDMSQNTEKAFQIAEHGGKSI